MYQQIEAETVSQLNRLFTLVLVSDDGSLQLLVKTRSNQLYPYFYQQKGMASGGLGWMEGELEKEEAIDKKQKTRRP
ncbi:hypothetical protein [Dickeya dadantii]|uniref:hypothetical protein n=1 Tax=Dickeya dadantii TaxID=204038 RepID=UPI001C0BDF5A|nr:hypothetical protein [Dickeya dadantii]QWT40132.1 hypothetical protein KNV89_17480 [Dickeya dadantii]